MRVGDLVVRSYVMPTLVPGLVVGEEIEVVEIQADPGGPWSYDQVSLIVSWSDGSLSRELSQELIYLEEVINESR